MPEDVLRYRVEIDPQQAEAALAAVRGGMGNALSGAAYGVGLMPGAFNSLRSDLAYGASSMGGATAAGITSSQQLAEDRFVQRMSTGAAEAALGLGTLGVVGAGLTGVSAATLGTSATASGLAFGGGLTMAAMGKTAGMIGSTLGFAASGIGAVGAAALSPAGLAVGAGVTAGAALVGGAYATVHSAERAVNDMQATFDIQNSLTSRGVSLTQARGAASRIVDAGAEMGAFTGAETAAMFDEFAASGAFDRYAANPQRLEQKMKERVQSVRQIMQALNVGSKAAVQMVNEVTSMGVESSDIASAMGSMGAGGRLLGQAGMQQASQMGASMAASMGMRGITGVNIGISSAVSAQTLGSQMDSATYRMLGGQQGIQSALMRSQMGFMNSGMGQAMVMGTMGGGMNQFMAGNMSTTQALMNAGQTFASQGPGALFAMDRAKADMSSTQVQGMRAMSALNMLDDLGMGASKEMLAQVMAAQDPSINFNTTEGRQMALAMAQDVTNPAAKMRELQALNAQHADVMANNTGVGAVARNAARGTWEYTTNQLIPNLAYGTANALVGGVTEAGARFVTGGVVGGFSLEDVRRSTGGISGLSEGSGMWENEDSRGMLKLGRWMGGRTGKFIQAMAGTSTVSGVMGTETESINRIMKLTGTDEGADAMSLLRKIGKFDFTDEQIADSAKYQKLIGGGIKADKDLVAKAKFKMLQSPAVKTQVMRLAKDGGTKSLKSAARYLGLGTSDADLAAVSEVMRGAGAEFAPDEVKMAASETSDKLRGEIFSDITSVSFKEAFGEGFGDRMFGGSFGQTLEGALTAGGTTEERVKAAAAIAQAAQASISGEGQADALKALSDAGISESVSGDIIAGFGDKKKARLTRSALRPILQKAVAQQTASAGAGSPGLLASMASRSKEFLSEFMGVGGMDQTMGADSSSVNLFDTASERRAAESLGAIQAQSSEQILLMDAIADKLERIANRLPQ